MAEVSVWKRVLMCLAKEGSDVRQARERLEQIVGEISRTHDRQKESAAEVVSELLSVLDRAAWRRRAARGDSSHRLASNGFLVMSSKYQGPERRHRAMRVKHERRGAH